MKRRMKARAPILILLLLSGLTPALAASNSVRLKPKDRVAGPSLPTQGVVIATHETVQPERAAEPGLNTLTGIEQLQSEFNKDKGNIRLIVILSPT